MSDPKCGCGYDIREAVVDRDDCLYPALLKAAEAALWQLDANGTAFVNELTETRETHALRTEVARAKAAPGREW